MRRLMASNVGQIAFLGPSGTYGETAAKHFQRRLRGGELVPCPTIKSVYHHPAAFLVLPIHNTIHGVVTDTADCLLSTLGGGGGPKVVADTALEISHQLVALRGVTLADVKWVRSHEQALGQSKIWLDANIPDSERISWPSTAGAALSLVEEGRRDGAAICSTAAVELLGDKVEVLHSGTQGVGNENYTQFVLLSRKDGECDIITRGEKGSAGYFACTGRGLNNVLGCGKEAYEWPRPAGDGSGDWTLVKRLDVGEVGEIDGAVCLGVYGVERITEGGKVLMNPGDVDSGFEGEE